ncbi:MAG TPA: DNA recombination protein RmuC, partial [Thermoanaerobaculia bacterium]
MPVLVPTLTFLAGGVLVWLLTRQQRSVLEERLRSREGDAARLAEVSAEAGRLREERAVLQTTVEKERQATAEKLRLLDEAQGRLSDAFKALSAEALQNNNASFVHLAKATLETFQ